MRGTRLLPVAGAILGTLLGLAAGAMLTMRIVRAGPLPGAWPLAVGFALQLALAVALGTAGYWALARVTPGTDAHPRP